MRTYMLTCLEKAIGGAIKGVFLFPVFVLLLYLTEH